MFSSVKHREVSVAAKKPVNNVKVKTNRHFVNSQVE